jgi:two-component system cell cycle response regulator DivK
MNRNILSHRLRRRDFDVLIAADGEDGVAMAAAKARSHLVDVSLPILDGWEVTRRLKTRRISHGSPSLA